MRWAWTSLYNCKQADNSLTMEQTDSLSFQHIPAISLWAHFVASIFLGAEAWKTRSRSSLHASVIFQVCVAANSYRSSDLLFAEKRHNLDILILRVVLSLRKNWDTLGPSHLKPTFKTLVTEVALLRGGMTKDWGTSTSPALWLQATSLYSGANAWCKLQAPNSFQQLPIGSLHILGVVWGCNVVICYSYSML